jgi:hypothetical protein
MSDDRDQKTDYSGQKLGGLKAGRPGSQNAERLII